MNNKDRVFLGIACIFIIFVAFLVTSWYTSDLEMLWLAAFLAVPFWAALFGFIIFLIIRFLTRADSTMVIWIVAFSVLIHVGLMVEEINIGAIKNLFDNHAKVLNTDESSRSLHEINLGEGKSLYFTDENDKEFQLNFEFAGKKTISKDSIIALAKQWLVSNGYGRSEINDMQAYPRYYRKGISFQMENPGQILLTFDLQDEPKKNQEKLSSIMLGLKFKNNSFIFEERAWTYK